MTETPPQFDPFPDDWQTALCIAAHPDDLEYGTAGAVAAWTRAGKTVTYLLVTSGEAGIDGLDPAECGPLRAVLMHRPGDELTIDYAWEAEAAIPCLCAAENCRGWIVAIEELHHVNRRSRKRA